MPQYQENHEDRKEEKYIQNFSKMTKLVFYFIFAALLGIIVRVVTPIKTHVVLSQLCKWFIVGLLLYALYLNVRLAYSSYIDYNNVPNALKPNVESSSFLSLFILFLLVVFVQGA